MSSSTNEYNLKRFTDESASINTSWHRHQMYTLERRLPNILLSNIYSHSALNVYTNYRAKDHGAPVTIPDFNTLKSDGGTSTSIWGEPNEIEYSANILFRDLKLDVEKKFHGDILHKVRRYYEMPVDIFYNDERISNKPFEDANISTYPIVLRVDTHIGGLLAQVVTSKLKIAQTKFAWADCSYKLTAALEIPSNDVNIKLNDFSVPTKTREFTYWALRLHTPDSNGRSYVFRIAFRRNLNKLKPKTLDDTKYMLTNNSTIDERRKFKVDMHKFGYDYECNIECEDYISGSEFIECFDAIFKYYKWQYENCNRTIQPICLKFKTATNLDDLTTRQIATLDTLEHVSWFDVENTDEQSSNVPKNMAEFIKYLGVYAYLVNSQNPNEIIKLDFKNLNLETLTQHGAGECQHVDNSEMFM